MASIVEGSNPHSCSISITNEEKELFDIIVKSLDWKGLSTIARVAGGWVRDKILNRSSDDIDIALDDQTGVEFAANINEYLEFIGQEVRTVAVIQANPDQSKHLETANIRVLGFEIDCVNLRTETYTDETRIPKIEFGSPLEDALRRDFTINSLFYNLSTRQIEDFTGMGFRDLKHKLIRTPLPARTTFTDDPLRILRAIRFASRYNFRLERELVDTACDPHVLVALSNKVSKERVLNELLGMLNLQGHPLISFNMIYQLGIFQILVPVPCPGEVLLLSETLFPFRDLRLRTTTGDSADLLVAGNGSIGYNPRLEVFETWQRLSMEVIGWLSLLSLDVSLGQRDIDASHGVRISADELVAVNIGCGDTQGVTSQKSKLYFAAFVSSFAGVLQVDKKGKSISLSTMILRDGLKVDNDTIKIAQIVLDLIVPIANCSVAHSAIPINQTAISDDSTMTESWSEFIQKSREEAGLIIRQCREQWRSAVDFACSFELASLGLHPGSHVNQIFNHNPDNIFNSLQLQDTIVSPSAMIVIARYQRLIHCWSVTLQLEYAYDLKPIYDGSQLMTLLPNLKRGPQFGAAVEEQIKWMLRNPDGAPDQLLDHLNAFIKSMNTGVVENGKGPAPLKVKGKTGKNSGDIK